LFKTKNFSQYNNNQSPEDGSRGFSGMSMDQYFSNISSKAKSKGW